MPPMEIRFGGYRPPASVHNRAATLFGDALQSRLGDAIDFRMTGNVIAEGRKAADLLDLVASGELTMCYFAASYLSDLVPELALFDLPFVIADRKTAYAALDGPLGTLLQDKMLAASGYRILGFWDNGFRHLTNRVRPIRRPEDCRGLTIRTLFSDLHTRTFRQLGFEPRALDVKDLLAGVEAGTIDAQENPLTNNWNFGIHRHHSYFTLTGHFLGSRCGSATRRVTGHGRRKFARRSMPQYPMPSPHNVVLPPQKMPTYYTSFPVRTSRLPNSRRKNARHLGSQLPPSLPSNATSSARPCSINCVRRPDRAGSDVFTVL